MGCLGTHLRPIHHRRKLDGRGRGFRLSEGVGGVLPVLLNVPRRRGVLVERLVQGGVPAQQEAHCTDYGSHGMALF